MITVSKEEYEKKQKCDVTIEKVVQKINKKLEELNEKYVDKDN